jgi:sugar phosphate isomerase/epimerase
MGLNVDQVGVQAHCLRREMSADFAGTLGRLRSMGFETIELCSFAGCAGNPWGDFGELATWEPGRIRSALDDAGLKCNATHFMHKELFPHNLGAAIHWAQSVGSQAIVLAGLPMAAGAGLQEWQAAFRSLNAIGHEMNKQGIKFAYHTQNEVWRTIDDVLLADEMFRLVEPAVCLIELDPSGALVYGTDWMAPVRTNPDRFLAMHLRDGARPPDHVPYLPALPLGAGDVDWAAALQTASDANISEHYLEMEVGPEFSVFDALRSSLDFLQRTRH